MTKRADYAASLDALVAGSNGFDDLERFLTAQSGLPGPRGNLELADAFAEVVARRGASAQLRERLDDWLALDEAAAPTNDPREYLPFCALQALGVVYVAAPGERRSIEMTFRRFAEDARWRAREGVAMALQRIGERDFESLRAICDDWLLEATPLGRRAIVAALAHPPILAVAGRAAYCLGLADRIVGDLVALGPNERKTEEFRVLRQGLEYAVSVFAAHDPEPGFELLEHWVMSDDADARRIARSNLGKARLAKKHPTRVAALVARMDQPGLEQPS